jgi:hypothetical protein
MGDFEHHLLESGMDALKSGSRRQARIMLERVTWLSPSLEDLVKAQFLLSELTEDPHEKRRLLEAVLGNQPGHADALRELARLGRETAAAEKAPPASVPQTPLSSAPAVAPTPGTPVFAREFLCRRCGETLRFTKDRAYLDCGYCGARVTLVSELERASLERDEEFLAPLTQTGLAPASIRIRSLACACGAVFAIPAVAQSLTCPFCAAIQDVTGASEQEWIPPALIIPFTIPREKALLALKNWLMAQWNRESVKILSMGDVYIPAWSFDIGGSLLPASTHRADQKTGWPVNRTNLAVPASHALPFEYRILYDRYDWSGAVPFAPVILSEVRTEVYRVLAGAAARVAREKVHLEEMKKKAPGTGVLLSTRGLSIRGFRQYLLPLWHARFQTSKGVKHAIINGQNGIVIA